MESKCINRFCPPTNLDREAFGTRWHCDDDLYIQLSDNPEKPKWEKISYLLQNAFSSFLNDNKFIDDCLSLYKDRLDRLNKEVIG